jgi:hypothetical protein
VGTINPSVTTAVTFTQLGNAMANAAPYTSDTTSNNGYDGLLTVLTTAGISGYVGAAAGSIATNGIAAFNTALTAMYEANLADPDVIYVDPIIRGAISKWILSNAAGAQNYRISIDHNEAGRIASGSLVASLFNPVTGKSIRLEAHPYMPYGCAIIQSETLPETVPNSGVGATSQIVSVQEYMSQAWTPIQFSYDFSTYWQGTLVHYAPAWSGALTGLTP